MSWPERDPRHYPRRDPRHYPRRDPRHYPRRDPRRERCKDEKNQVPQCLSFSHSGAQRNSLDSTTPHRCKLPETHYKRLKPWG